MGNEKRALPPAVGGSSLLTVFAVLCLTVFALLSLATVQADARLSDASVQTVAGYYKADHAAQEILACLRSGAPLPEGRTVRATHGPDHKGTLFSYTAPSPARRTWRWRSSWRRTAAIPSCAGRRVPRPSGRATIPWTCGTAYCFKGGFLCQSCWNTCSGW